MYVGPVWAGTLGNVAKYGHNTADLFPKFDYPYLFVMSGNDKTIDPFVSRDFENLSISTDKTHFFAPEVWHSVFFDK